MTRSQIRLVAGLFILLGVEVLAAQEGADLVTDRPDQTESAVVVPRGAFQIELGASYLRDDQPAQRLEILEGPGTLVRWGLASRVELRLAWPGWSELESRRGGNSTTLRGVGDPELGTKISLASAERGDALDLALLAHVSLPVGDELLGSPRADPALRLNGAHELGERLGLGWNLGYQLGSFEDSRGEVHTLGRFLYTAALGIDLAPRWGAFVELFGDLPSSDPEPAVHLFDGGLTFLLGERLQADLFGGCGLNDAAPDWFVGVGLSLRVPR